MKLRPYQKNVIAEVHASQSRRVVVYAPTGSGKTIIACQLIADLLEQGLRVLVLVDQVNLIEQTSQKLSLWNILHGFIKTGKPENISALVQVASTQTLDRRHSWKTQPFDVVILDECHTTGFSKAAKKIRSLMPKARHIGLTATPWRSAKHEGLGDLFDELIKAPLPSELIKMGFWVQPVYYQLAELNLKGVKVKCGDYDLERLSLICNTPDQVRLAISEYKRLAPNRSALAFAVDIEHAEALAAEARRQGIKAQAITSKTSDKDRERFIAQFASGELMLLASCGCLSVGFDQPRASVALLCRPTKSLILFLQQIGRVLRLYPDKKDALVLDFAGNVFVHGRVEDIEDITLDKGGEAPKATGKPPIKLCPSTKRDRDGKTGCNAVIPLFESKCPHCGYLFGTPKVTPIGQLQEAPDNKTAIRKFFGVAQKYGKSKGWLYGKLRSLPNLCKSDFEFYGKLMNYKNPQGWAYYQMKELKQTA